MNGLPIMNNKKEWVMFTQQNLQSSIPTDTSPSGPMKTSPSTSPSAKKNSKAEQEETDSIENIIFISSLTNHLLSSLIPPFITLLTHSLYNLFHSQITKNLQNNTSTPQIISEQWKSPSPTDFKQNIMLQQFFYMFHLQYMLGRLKLLYNYMHINKHNIHIQITENQQLVFHTLLTYTQEMQMKTVMRVAGGWVRDKIMGIQSKDIDIALDNMMGQQFVLLLKKHAETKNQKISNFGVTRVNPDLSKHLETATAKIHNEQIDFVNLRSETYNNESRIPIIAIGTPLEDALRRDFTMNSLFYNINTKEIQDYTQQGIHDIAEKIIRTPLDPLVTFKDDPLRILRCFRFKSRFNFTIHEDIYKSLEDKAIHESLRTKVSKQRIGIELAGSLKAQFPLLALWQIYKYNFWNIVFEIPEESTLKDKDLISSIPQYSFNVCQRGLQSLQKNAFLTSPQLISTGQDPKDKRSRYTKSQLKLMVNLTFITIVYRNYKMTEGKKMVSLLDHIIKNELKYSAKVARFVCKCGELINELQKIIISPKGNDLKVKIIRWLRLAEQKWQIVIHIMIAMRLADQSYLAQIQTQPLELRDYIFNYHLQESYLTESFIDGNFLTKKGLKGPILRVILENTILWRTLNPSSSKQEFLQLFQKNLPFFQNQKSYL